MIHTDEERYGKLYIAKTAKACGETFDEVWAEIQETIAAAWSNANKDPDAKKMQNMLFPEGMPTPDVFVIRMSNYIKDKR